MGTTTSSDTTSSTGTSVVRISNKIISTNVVEYLIQRVNAESVTTLDLRTVRYEDPTDVNRLCEEMKSKRLTSLSLQTHSVADDDVLNIAKNLPNLKALDLNQCNVERAGVSHIVKYLPNLTELCLDGCFIDNAAIEEIATKLTKLTMLRLCGNNIGTANAKTIATNLPNLTTLALRRCLIDNEGFEAIATMGRLTALDLTDNLITCVKNELPTMPNLTTLVFWQNRVGDEGIEEISTKFPNLRTLDVAYNEIKNVNLMSPMPNLTTLIISHNRIERDFVGISTTFPNLTTLEAKGNTIGDVVEISKLTKLTTLDLSSNLIGGFGARWFQRMKTLKTLDLSSNSIDMGGAFAVATITTLETLNLRHNAIGYEGAIVIMNDLRSLKWLDLSDNGIGNERVGQIAECLSNLTKLESLELGGNIRLNAERDWNRFIDVFERHPTWFHFGGTYYDTGRIAEIQRNKRMRSFIDSDAVTRFTARRTSRHFDDFGSDDIKTTIKKFL